MKKIITTFLFSFLVVMCMAQDTLLYENFDVDPTSGSNWMEATLPPAATNDPNWYNWDQDGLPDMSPQSRPGLWFWQTGGFADQDTLDGCMASNSWTTDPNPVENYLITPALQVNYTDAVVHWKSATFQTPRYLDGYKILVSTTNNDLTSFNDEIFRAAEMTGWLNEPGDPPDSTFGSYLFAPPGAWIQGLTGDPTEVVYMGDSMRLRGVQKDTSVSLAAYAGQTIYIAFEHYTVDDNLLSLDDILVTGTTLIGVNEINRDPLKMYAYPNPADRNTTLNFVLNAASNVMVKVTNVLGKEVFMRQVAGVSGKNSLPVNVEGYAAGTYFYTVTSGTATSTGKFSVVR